MKRTAQAVESRGLAVFEVFACLRSRLGCGMQAAGDIVVVVRWRRRNLLINLCARPGPRRSREAVCMVKKKEIG